MTKRRVVNIRRRTTLRFPDGSSADVWPGMELPGLVKPEKRRPGRPAHPATLALRQVMESHRRLGIGWPVDDYLRKVMLKRYAGAEPMSPGVARATVYREADEYSIELPDGRKTRKGRKAKD